MQLILQKYSGIYRKMCNKDNKTPSLTLRFYLNCLIVLAIIMIDRTESFTGGKVMLIVLWLTKNIKP